METDSRSSTTNYGLTLYKNVDFSVGDNVQIVFRPFDLDVNTRIIAMSFNPFNRREISIEVGDYISNHIPIKSRIVSKGAFVSIAFMTYRRKNMLIKIHSA